MNLCNVCFLMLFSHHPPPPPPPPPTQFLEVILAKRKHSARTSTAQGNHHFTQLHLNVICYDFCCHTSIFVTVVKLLKFQNFFFFSLKKSNQWKFREFTETVAMHTTLIKHTTFSMLLSGMSNNLVVLLLWWMVL